MTTRADEIAERESLAKAAIKRTYGTEDGEFGATLFATHHLAEIDAKYWQERLGTSTPEPIQVFEILELRSHWGGDDEDGINVFDFTLPEGVTNYVLSVRFDEAGGIEEISMES